MNTPIKPEDLPDAGKIPPNKDFDEFLEWTEEEEEEFLRILNDPENDGMDGATT